MSKLAAAPAGRTGAKTKPYVVTPAKVDQFAKAYNLSRARIWSIKREIDAGVKQGAHAKEAK